MTWSLQPTRHELAPRAASSSTDRVGAEAIGTDPSFGLSPTTNCYGRYLHGTIWLVYDAQSVPRQHHISANCLNSKVIVFYRLSSKKLPKISNFFPHPRIITLTVCAHITPISFHFHSPMPWWTGVPTCKLGVTSSIPLQSPHAMLPLSMSSSITLHSIIGPMLHQHHMLMLSFNPLHLRCHILHHMYTCHMHTLHLRSPLRRMLLQYIGDIDRRSFPICMPVVSVPSYSMYSL
jgi:hypothetical protein